MQSCDDLHQRRRKELTPRSLRALSHASEDGLVVGAMEAMALLSGMEREQRFPVKSEAWIHEAWLPGAMLTGWLPGHIIYHHEYKAHASCCIERLPGRGCRPAPGFLI